MIPNISASLTWLEKHPNAIIGIQRGIERETLRITKDGNLSSTSHPNTLGSALTHPWITTDFAESLLEFITPVDNKIENSLNFLSDLHAYTLKNLDNEYFWPFSMPCFIGKEEDIQLAQYGHSNVGKFKTLYREGLKQRYGALMQTISGVHYNFSFPIGFWQAYLGIEDEVSGKDQISAGYLKLIRNYYRFGWVIPYLFGASPAICESFLNGKKTNLPFEYENNLAYLPYGTSLRLSDLGYTSSAQSNLGMTFNDLDTYIAQLKHAITLKSPEFSEIGLEKAGKRIQINTNILQIENELYAPIRPKRVTKPNESPSDALARGGIQYIEVRSLDINPFSPIGVSEEQARFLDLFLIWCALADAPEMNSEEIQCTKKNWNRVILEGRKPEQTIGIGCDSQQQPLRIVGKNLFIDLMRVAKVLDNHNGDHRYNEICEKLVIAFDEPELTYSARLLSQFKAEGMSNVGKRLAKEYAKALTNESYRHLTAEELEVQRAESLEKQKRVEESDNISFDEYLKLHGG